jgi:leucyl aminopeptidase
VTSYPDRRSDETGAVAIIGALFLREFAGDRPWAHLDIAGPAFSDEGNAFYTAKGGTGVPVRTLVRYLTDRA